MHMHAPPPEPFPGYNEAIGLCIADLGNLATVIGEALERCDLPEASRNAHAMRGLAANFGVEELVGPLSRLEAACRLQDMAAAWSALAALCQAMGPAVGRLQDPQAD